LKNNNLDLDMSTENSGRIFISYGHDEFSGFALSLADFLRGHGYEVFIDKDGIHTGQEWETNLEDGLKWAKSGTKDGIFILLMTPYSVRRPNGYCLNEMLYALDLGLKMVPVMLKTVTPPLSIYRIQYLDLTSTANDTDVCFPKILNCISAPTNDSVENSYRVTPLMQHLCPLDFSGEIELFSKDFVGRKWSIPMIEDWASNNHGVLAITGSAGVGKTALAVFLYNHLPDAIAFYMFRRNDSAKLPLKRFVTTIAYEISTQIKEYRDILLALDSEEIDNTGSASRLFQKLIIAPLKRIERPQEPKYILIDGLDEAESEKYNPVAVFLDENIHFLPDWVNVIITTRPQVASIKPLNADKVFSLDELGAENIADIKQYVSAVMPYLDEQQQVSIVEKSHGSFLYVKRISEWYRTHQAEDLPLDIVAFYSSDFIRLFPTEASYANSRFFLEIIIASSIPLSKALLHIIANDSPYKLDEFLTTFRDLVKEGKDSRIRVDHSSFSEWLVSEQAGVYRINAMEGRQRIIDLLKRYMVWEVEDGNESSTRVDKFCKRIEDIESSLCLKYDDELIPIYCNVMEESGEWTAFMEFSYWYLTSPHINYQFMEMLCRAVDTYYNDLKHISSYSLIDQGLTESIKHSYDYMMEKASHGITTELTKPAYIILNDLRVVIDNTENNQRLEDYILSIMNAFPNLLGVFSSAMFHNEVDFGFADSIVELFTGLRDSQRITNPDILEWLSKARVWD